MDLQPVHLLVHGASVGEQHRHGDERAQRRRNALPEIQTRQRSGVHLPSDRRVHERDRGIERRQRADHCERREIPRVRHLHAVHREQRPDEHGARERDRHPDEPGHPQGRVEAPRPVAYRHAKADPFFERTPAAADQVMTRIVFAFFNGSRVAQRDRVARDVEFGSAGAACDLFDRVAVQVARGEIHFREPAGGSEHTVHEAHALDDGRPINIGNTAHARDDVAHGDVGAALAQVLFLHHAVDAGALRGKSFLEPAADTAGLRILIAQPMHEFDGERRCERRMLQPSKRDASLGRAGCARRREHQIGKRIGLEPTRPADFYASRSTAQVFDKHDPQRDRSSPQFTDRQRLHALVCAQETPQRLCVETAIRVRDECPRDAEDAGVAGKRTCRELR